MNFVTGLINWLNDVSEPLTELVKDENFKGEFLLSAGAKVKPQAEEKARAEEKLNIVLRILDAIRKKLGFDETDIPKVNNLAALAAVLVELKLAFDAIKELLKSCDFLGLEDENAPTDVELENAINNAVGALSRSLFQQAIKKSAPAVATFAEATGIFSDELSETKRALDLVLFPLFQLSRTLPNVDQGDIDKVDEFIIPTGDFKADNTVRITKGLFLLLSIGFIFIEKYLKPPGRFLFNFGHELAPERDTFPNLAMVAGRVLQMQFQPSEFLYSEDADPADFKESGTSDAFLSFASIPVFAPGALPGSSPDGYQYVLGVEINPGDFGADTGNFSVRFLKNLFGCFFWGHETPFHFKGTGLPEDNGTSDGEPFISMRYNGKQPKEGEAPENASGGNISLDLIPNFKTVNGKRDLDTTIILRLQDFSYSLSSEGRDGFLQKLLPEKGAKINLGLSVTYSLLLNKWTLEGLDKNDGFLLLFNIDKKIFKAIEVPTFYLGLKPFINEQKKLRGCVLEASAMIRTTIGPFQLTVDRVGASLALNFPEKSDGNLGFADLDVSLKPPSGIGFLVKAPTVSGGGFLSVDPDNHQYYGAGELTIQLVNYKLSLKIIAIILTQLPDGKKGFSFLLMASLEFSPAIDTPLGFKLKGLGVIVAIHRSMSTDALQSAIRDDRLDLILFPDNPVGNAPTIVKAMNSLFPPTEGRYVFAVMARIVWGSEKLVDLKVGLLVEVPAPIKIAVVGVMKVQVEKGGKSIVKLQVNFVSILDFGKKIFSIDAAIYDSKFLIFDIRGELFVRYRWGDDSVFLISVGGWHPDFQVPTGLNLPAKPQRLIIPLMDTSSAKLILSCYMAVTSNTFQAGFKIDLKIKWSKFRLEAGLSVDALFHFDPFYFVVDFEGKLRIFWGDSTLAGVTVKGAFSGTNPWRIRGTATFEIWIWDYDVDFDKHTGEDISEVSQDVDVLPLIEKAISDKANWQSSLPKGISTDVILRNTESDAAGGETDTSPDIIADPLSRIEVMQQVLPLGIRIDKLGTQKIKGARKYDLAAEMEGAGSMDGLDLEDHFAPAMFINMEDAEKLTRKSFERMKAGHSFSDAETLTCGMAQISKCEYDDQFYDPLVPPDNPGKPPVSTEHFAIWLNNNSVAKSAGGRKTAVRKEIVARQTASRVDPFIVADAVTGLKIDDVAGQKSMTGAYYELWKFQKINPSRKLSVIRESELM